LTDRHAGARDYDGAKIAHPCIAPILGVFAQGSPMKIPAFFAIAIAMSVSTFAQTSPPSAPTLTAGAEFKGLRLDWDSVTGATSYRLEYRAHQTGSFVQQGSAFASTVTSARLTFPLHLFDWTYARYRLAACNSAGCSRSAEVSVSDLRRDAVGYFKAPTPLAEGKLGDEISLSADGYTLVATAPGETTPTANGGSAGGAVYVFRGGSDGKWRQRSRIPAHTVSGSQSVSLDAAVSASGNTVAVGLLNEREVDVYFWKNSVYTAKRIPKPALDYIESVQLSDSGYVLAVIGRVGSNSVTTIYKSTNGVWQGIRTISEVDYCQHTTLTRDGKTLAAICSEWDGAGGSRDYVLRLSGSTFSARTEIDIDYFTPRDEQAHDTHSHDALGVDATGDTFAVQVDHGGDDYARVFVYHRDAGVYNRVASFYCENWNTDDLTSNYLFGTMISISGDGHTMAIGHTGDRGRGLGPRAAPLLPGTTATGAGFIYRLTDSWKLENVVKPNYVNSPNTYSADFPGTIALSGTGKTLVVGMAGEDSSASGIDGDWANASLPNSGALFMY
jgi:hypothetical protein